MKKKLTITIDERVYEDLQKVVGRRQMSRFIKDLVRPHVLAPDVEAGYLQMSQNEARQAEAHAWAGGMINDVNDDPGLGLVGQIRSFRRCQSPETASCGYPQ